MTDDPFVPKCENARLEFHHVDAGYNGGLALADVSFNIPQGMRVALVGPNGAGKSTLLKVMTRLLPIRRGEVLIHGLPLGHHVDCLAYVPQRDEINWRFPATVQDVVLMGRFGKKRWLKKLNKEDTDVAMRSMDEMGILPIRNTSLADLSGGQQQRVFLARALAQEPHILLMDEPFNGVDQTTQDKVIEILAHLRSMCVTTLVATHDLNLAAGRFDHILLLNHTLIAAGPPDQVMRKDIIRRAFGPSALDFDNLVVVDQYCPE
ncbi:MAG: metal ABC transporter ATP-binding protein [Anaerolineales bacterium]|nr:metal ABC transporter ATP-binding protein [Anaerolineales bacterium]